jgi:hypothetical protein
MLARKDTAGSHQMRYAKSHNPVSVDVVVRGYSDAR